MSLGNVNNNPGNLLSNGINWQGLVGTSQANGLGYAKFDTPASGVRALAVDLKTAIGNGYNTLAKLIAHYLGNPIKNGVIQPTSANPNPMNYLTTVEQVSGLGPNSTISASNVGSIAQGIIKAEGNTASGADLNTGLARAGLGNGTMTQAQTGFSGAIGSISNDFSTGLNSVITNPFGSASILGSTFGAGVQGLTTDPLGSLGGLGSSFNTGLNTSAQAAADTSSQAIAAAGNTIGGAISGVQGLISNLFSASNLERVVLVVVGILLLAAAIFTLSKSYVPPAAAAALA